jgi:segregation and condensation protein B
MSELSKKIESIIFYKGEEISFRELSKLLGAGENEIKTEVDVLKEKYINAGVKLITTDSSVLMTTGEEVSEIIESLEREGYEKELTKAALETLTIILYRGPLKRSMIDFVRGVNSQFTLRNLLIRGLIEKMPDPKDERAYLYKPTSDLLRFLSVSDIKELQEYKEINDKVDSFITNSKEKNA